MLGQAVLVTGAGGDIGRAVARRLVGAGARVALVDHPERTAALEATASECAALAVDGAPFQLTFDICDEVAVSDAISAIVDQTGVPVGVFHSAGYQGEFANVTDYRPAEFRRVLDINVTGTFNVLSAAAAALRIAGLGGSIVNAASMAGVSGATNMAAYSAAKGAVISMTKAAAKDLAADRIRVNAVSPGFVGEGTMWHRQIEQQAGVPSRFYSADPVVVEEQMLAQTAMGRGATLDEVAAAVMFLLSDDSSYVTGLNLELAGGPT